MLPNGRRPVAQHHARGRGLLAGAVAVLMLVSAPGCSSTEWVSLRKVPKNPLAAQLNLFARGGPRPTERTMLLVRRYDLTDDLENDSSQLLVKLRAIINREPSADKLYSLAELAYLAGKKAEGKDPQSALQLHGAALMHSYLYLFDENFAALRNPYDPEFRGACDLYNGALESALRIVKKQGHLRPGSTQRIQTANQTMDVSVVIRGTTWTAEDFDRFEFVSDYEVTGLRNQYQTFGLGVPLIAVRKVRPVQSPVERFYPPGLSFPVTAFLRLVPSREGGSNHYVALLELYDPLTSSDIMIGGRRVPLESDLSTPLAYFLSRPELQNLDLATTGFLNPDEAKKMKGLYMLEPYQPGKIPVLMVHGIWSSPITWMEMFNDLRSTPEIRDHYQFWFYLYPTGVPFWHSAAQLRQDLAQMRQVLDPYRQEAALDQMVLVGHSMGGLVSKLQTIDSRNDFWNIISDRPFDTIKASNETRQTLANTFFFRPNPSIRRVVSIGTPHRGSKFANDTARYFASKLITLPKMLVNTTQQLRRDNPGAFRESNLLDIPTSIDALSPDSPILPVILSAERPPWVKYHNIVGEIPRKGFIGRVVGGSDGVVSYASAHLESVESEIVVNADHTSVHSHPRSVLEVRRILLEHLSEISPAPASPLESRPWTAGNDAVQPPLQPGPVIPAAPRNANGRLPQVPLR